MLILLTSIQDAEISAGGQRILLVEQIAHLATKHPSVDEVPPIEAYHSKSKPLCQTCSYER